MTSLNILLIIFNVVMFVVVIVLLVKCLQGENLINHIRIQMLKRMIRVDENNYQGIFVLLKKVKLTDHNKFLSFRVSYFKTFGDEYQQHEFGNEDNEPFVSLGDMKKCNTVDDIKKIIDDAKRTVQIVYNCIPLF